MARSSASFGVLLYAIHLLCRPKSLATQRATQVMPSSITSKLAELRTNARKLLPRLISNSPSPAKNCNGQAASPIFSILPAELRQLIWEATFQGRKVHVQWDGRRFNGIRCKVSDIDDFSLDNHEVCAKEGRWSATDRG